MAKKIRTILKGYFDTGDIPTSDNYDNFIDSGLNLSETGTETSLGIISASYLDAANGITSSGNFYGGTMELTGDISCSFISASGITVTSFPVINSASDITASGWIKAPNISSSNTIYSNNITASGNFRIAGSSSFDGEITASNISASGYISASQFIGTLVGGTQANIVQLGTLNQLVVDGNTNIQGGTITLQPTSNVTLTGGLSSSGHISCSILEAHHIVTATGGHITASRATISASKLEVDEITYAGSNTKGLTLSSNITASGYDISGSNIRASSYVLGGTALSTTFTELNYLSGLTSGEATQIKNIGSNAISNTEWSYVASMDQHVHTTSTPAFSGIVSNGTDSTDTTWSESGSFSAAGHSFQITFTGLPIISHERRITDEYMIINNEVVRSTSNVIAQPRYTAGQQRIEPVIYDIANERFSLTLRNIEYITNVDAGADLTINFFIIK